MPVVSIVLPLLAGVVAFVIIAAVFTALEWRSGHRWWRRADLSTDVTWTLLTLAGVHQAGKVGAVVAALVVGVGVFGAPIDSLRDLKEWFMTRETWASALPLGLQIVLGLLIHDFGHYLSHRLFHAQRRLWPFHAVHHSPPRLDWFATLRGHPVNDILQRAISVTPLLLLGFRPQVVAAVAPLLVLYGLLLHADIAWDYGPLKRVIASPRFHRWHHANVDGARACNFAGLFAFIDVVFGTYHLPAGAPAQTGVDDDVPARPLRQLLWSFRASWRAR